RPGPEERSPRLRARAVDARAPPAPRRRARGARGGAGDAPPALVREPPRAVRGRHVVAPPGGVPGPPGGRARALVGPGGPARREREAADAVGRGAARPRRLAPAGLRIGFP